MPSPREARETEQVFRSANRSIGDVASALAIDGAVPFLCECSDPACRALIRMPWSEFEALHAHPDRFAVLPGHELRAVEQVVSEAHGYFVVDKGPQRA
jgi:hypothetical protein